MNKGPKTIAAAPSGKKPRKQVITGRIAVKHVPKDSDEAARQTRAGQFALAAESLSQLVRENPDDYLAWGRLATAEIARHRYSEALAAVDRALALNTGAWWIRVVRANILSNLRDYERSLPLFEILHHEKPGNIDVLNGLKIGHYHTGDRKKALEFGGRALQLIDERASANDLSPLERHEQKSPQRTKRVIAFSLFGSKPAYLYGAMINVRLAHYLFPGWSCRIYVDGDVPPSVIANLRHAGAELVFGNVLFPNVPPYFWRFLVADDPEVRIFLCRDCDSRLTARDTVAVATWLDDGRPFHVVRDHVLHNMPILAGLWGGYANFSWGMQRRIADFLKDGMDNSYGSDQRFLAQCIWPLIRDDCVSLDSYYSLAGGEPMPVFAKGVDNDHAGMGIASEKVLKKEARMFGIPWPIA